MASPEEVVQSLPETLPEDFSEWDGESSPPTASGKPGALRASQPFAENTKPQRQPARRETFSTAPVESPRDTRSPMSPEGVFKPQKFSSSMVDKLPSRPLQRPESGHTTNEGAPAPNPANTASADRLRKTAEMRTAARLETDAILFQGFSSNADDFEEEKSAKKKWVIVAAVSACAILLLLIFIIPLFRHGTKAAAKQSVQSSPVATEVQVNATTIKPSASEPLNQDKALAKPQETKDDLSNNEEDGVNSQPVRADVMYDQLTAPTRIPQEMKNQVADNAPPPANFATEGMGGGSTNASVFNGPAQSVVKAKPVVISAGVAVGMLIQKTTPAYPSIAKSARVSGTVVLQATISKEGAIKDLRVVDGPTMLRKPAIDAVRTWRYKPYKLNGEPTEVETTINVIFSLGN